MRKMGLAGLVGLAILGCGKKPVPVPDVPVRAAREVKQEAVQPPKPKEVFIERYTLKPGEKISADGKNYNVLAGSGKDYFRSPGPNETYTEGVVGTWYHEVNVGKAGENSDYDLVTDEIIVKPDNSFNYTRSWNKFVVESGTIRFKEIKKSSPLNGSWKLEGNYLEMRVEK